MTSKIIWIDKNGRKYTEPEITDEHLANIIKHLTVRANRSQLLLEGFNALSKYRSDKKQHSKDTLNEILNTRFSDKEDVFFDLDEGLF